MSLPDTHTDPELDPFAPEDWYDGTDLDTWGYPTEGQHFDTRQEERGER